MSSTLSPLNSIIASAPPLHLPCRENGAGARIVDVLVVPTPDATADAPSNMPAAGAFGVQLALHPLSGSVRAPRSQLKTP